MIIQIYVCILLLTFCPASYDEMLDVCSKVVGNPNRLSSIQVPFIRICRFWTFVFDVIETLACCSGLNYPPWHLKLSHFRIEWKNQRRCSKRSSRIHGSSTRLSSCFWTKKIYWKKRSCIRILLTTSPSTMVSQLLYYLNNSNI